MLFVEKRDLFHEHNPITCLHVCNYNLSITIVIWNIYLVCVLFVCVLPVYLFVLYCFICIIVFYLFALFV